MSNQGGLGEAKNPSETESPGEAENPGVIDNPSAALDPIEREAHDWVVRFASGAATEVDLRNGKFWCDRSPEHAAAFAKASRLWDGLRPDVFTASRQASDKASHHVQTGSFLARPIARRVVLGGAVAACAAATAYAVARPPLGLWPSWSEFAADYRTKTGEQRSVAIADNVSIEMNTQTSIGVKQATSVADRIELIAGEAMISTAVGMPQPFVVVSGEGRASTTGAKFNIRNDGYSVCVTCIEGDVRVEHRSAAASLRTRQQVTYDSHGLGAVAAADPDSVMAWREGLLIFHATPVRDVIAEVNRYRPGKIILVNSALGQRLLSANFHIRNVNAIVGQIERLFDAKVTSFPGGIVLVS